MQFALTVPSIRDRVAQTAAKLVLEPIFEADFEDSAYGYRPRRSGVGAVKEVRRLIRQGYTDVVDADLSKYLDRASYCTLVSEAWLKRVGLWQFSLSHRPFLRSRLT